MTRPSVAGGADGRPRPRRRWAWTLGLAGLLLVGAAAVVLHSPWMSVREIEIVGAVHADVEAGLAAAGVGEGAIMVWLRPGAIEDVLAADPWVREVRVERIFPNRLVVEVLEQSPAVWVRGEGRWMLLSRTGVVIAVADTAGEGVLRAEVFYPDHDPGEQPPGSEWGELADLGVVLEDLAAGAVVTREGGELWLSAQGCRARLGPASRLADKGRVFVALLAQGLAPGSEVDLIAPTRPALVGPAAGNGNGGGEEAEG